MLAKDGFGSYQSGVAAVAAQPTFRLVLVTDCQLLDEEQTLARLRTLPLDGRVGVEVRERAMSGRALFDFTRRVHDVVRARGAALVVNDRLDIARTVEADAIHLPETGIPVGAARRIVGANVMIGQSIHSVYECEYTIADYIRFGPVFQTPSKAAFGQPQGLARLRDVVTRARGRPVFAVGGFETALQVKAAREAGAWGVAVIRAWLTSAEPWLPAMLAALS